MPMYLCPCVCTCVDRKNTKTQIDSRHLVDRTRMMFDVDVNKNSIDTWPMLAKAQAALTAQGADYSALQHFFDEGSASKRNNLRGL